MAIEPDKLEKAKELFEELISIAELYVLHIGEVSDGALASFESAFSTAMRPLLFGTILPDTTGNDLQRACRQEIETFRACVEHVLERRMLEKGPVHYKAGDDLQTQLRAFKKRKGDGLRVPRRIATLAVMAFLRSQGLENLIPDLRIVEDGDTHWAWWTNPKDTTSYIHDDLGIEWYGSTASDGKDT